MHSAWNFDPNPMGLVMGPKPTNPFFLSDKGKAGGKGDPPSLYGPYGNLSLLGQTLKLF